MNHGKCRVPAYPPFGICYACSPPRARVTRKAVLSVALIKRRPLWRFLSYRGVRLFVSPASAPGFLSTRLRLDAVGRVECVEDPTAHPDKCRPPLLCRRCRLYGPFVFSHVVASVSRVWSDACGTTSRHYSCLRRSLFDRACVCAIKRVRVFVVYRISATARL